MPILTALILGYLLTWLLIPIILLANKRPAATIAWIWSIVLFPYVGPLCYWAFGSERIHRRRLRRRQRFRDELRPDIVRAQQEKSLGGSDEKERAYLRLLSKLNGIEPAPAREIELLYGAPAFFEQLHHAIEGARHHAHIQFYTWRDDRHGKALLEALVRAAERGVEVRLLIDEVGSVGLRRKTFAPLIKAGGKFSWALTIDPLRNRFFWHLRNHRKLQVIDGETAFVGGMNVGAEYFGEDEAIGQWRDAQLRIAGPAVATLQESFADDWYFATEEKIVDEAYYGPATQREAQPTASIPVQVISGGPDSGDQPMQRSFVAMLNNASQRVWLSAGYFVPDQLILTALELCAAREVDVRLLLSRHSDFPWLIHASRSYYEELLRAGVQIWEYTAGFMHAKTMLIDESWLMVGSANWDIRSMRLNFELGVLAKSRSAAQRLEAIFLEEFTRADQVRIEEFLERPWSNRLREAVVRPISPIL